MTKRYKEIMGDNVNISQLWWSVQDHIFCKNYKPKKWIFVESLHCITETNIILCVTWNLN